MATTGTLSLTISNGASLSPAGTLGSSRPTAIVMPGTWTTANLTFQGSYDGTNFQNVYDDAGTELTVTAAASRNIALGATAQLALGAFQALKVRSGTSGAVVNQNQDSTVLLVLATN